MPPPLGLIITVSVLVAAGIACYESPQVREWINQRRHKMAMALHSLGDEVDPHPRSRKRSIDPSMREDESEEAAEKRRQARAEILERGRILEEKRRRSSTNSKVVNPSQSFDTLVDKDGSLLIPKEGIETSEPQQSTTTATELQPPQDGLTRRHDGPPADLLTQLESTMQQTFNFNPPPRHRSGAGSPTLSESTHASDYLVNLTPTSTISGQDRDGPEPQSREQEQEQNRDQRSRSETAYFTPSPFTSQSLSPRSAPEPVSFSTASSANYYYAHPSNPNPFADPSPSQFQFQSPNAHLAPPPPPSSAPSIAGSEIEHIHARDTDSDADGVLSEFEDGIRTPGSVWTEVESVVSEQ